MIAATKHCEEVDFETAPCKSWVKVAIPHFLGGKLPRNMIFFKLGIGVVMASILERANQSSAIVDSIR
jgi:hypothetical protein